MEKKVETDGKKWETAGQKVETDGKKWETAGKKREVREGGPRGLSRG